MSRSLREREIARRLEDVPAPEPPADLLARIKREIPAELPEMPEMARPGGDGMGSPLPHRQFWLVAASLAAVVGAGLVGLQVMERVGPPAEVAVEEPAAPPARAAAARPEGPVAAEPAAPAELKEEASAAEPGPPAERERDEAAAALPPPPPPPPPPPAPRAQAAPPSAKLRAQGSASAPAQPVEVPELIDGLDVAAESPLRVSADEQRGVEGGVPGGVVGGVVGGVAGGVPRAVQKPSTGGTAEPNDQPYGDVFFRSHGVNPFIDTEDDRLSTFGLDVDAGSYTVARRYLDDGHLPPAPAIRVEEMVNFFDYGDRPPARGDFAIHVEGAPTPFVEGERYRLVRFGIRGREVPMENRKRRIFVEELTGTLQTIATDAKVQVEWNPQVVARYRLLGYENRDVADERFRDDSVDAGEVGAGHSVTALYEVKLQPEAPAGRPLGTIRLRYRSEETEKVTELEHEVRQADLAATWEQASPALRLAGLVAEYAELLRESYWARGGDLRDVARHARALAPAFPGNERVADFVNLAERAARLAAGRRK